MTAINPSASVSGFSEGLAPSYNKIDMKAKAKYEKKKGFPPARKSKNRQAYSQTPPSLTNPLI